MGHLVRVCIATLENLTHCVSFQFCVYYYEVESALVCLSASQQLQVNAYD